jgi:transporter family-2 protein
VSPVRAASAPPTSSRAGTAALAAAVVAGGFVALQQRLNGALGVALGDALLAALVSFLAGLVLVAAVVAARPAARAAVPAVRTVPWWGRLGGLGGAGLVAVGAAATPVVGVALLTVGLVAGQTTGGLLVDRAGIGPSGPHLLTAPRLAGAALCLAAVVLASLGRDARAASPLLLVLVVVAGALTSLQQGLNGRVRAATGDAAVTTLLNFAVGTAALALGCLLTAAGHGLPARHWPGAGQVYLYLGGPIGASFVAVAAAVVRRLGVLRLGLATIAGQLVGALLLDVIAPATGRGVAVGTVAGAALTLVAVAVSGWEVRE